jgi:hypothetical protein
MIDPGKILAASDRHSNDRSKLVVSTRLSLDWQTATLIMTTSHVKFSPTAIGLVTPTNRELGEVGSSTNNR